MRPPRSNSKLDNIKIPRKKEPFSFSIVLMGEIDYYSENDEFTVDPLFEMNPWGDTLDATRSASVLEQAL